MDGDESESMLELKEIVASALESKGVLNTIRVSELFLYNHSQFDHSLLNYYNLHYIVHSLLNCSTFFIKSCFMQTDIVMDVVACWLVS